MFFNPHQFDEQMASLSEVENKMDLILSELKLQSLYKGLCTTDKILIVHIVIQNPTLKYLIQFLGGGGRTSKLFHFHIWCLLLMEAAMPLEFIWEEKKLAWVER